MYISESFESGFLTQRGEALDTRMPVATIQFYRTILANDNIYMTAAGLDFSPERDIICYQPSRYELFDRGLPTFAIMLPYCGAGQSFTT